MLIVNIYFIFYEFSNVFFKQSAISAFLYCFGFNQKKESGRKSKYLQSTVEFLTELVAFIHIIYVLIVKM